MWFNISPFQNSRSYLVLYSLKVLGWTMVSLSDSVLGKSKIAIPERRIIKEGNKNFHFKNGIKRWINEIINIPFLFFVWTSPANIIEDSTTKLEIGRPSICDAVISVKLFWLRNLCFYKYITYVGMGLRPRWWWKGSDGISCQEPASLIQSGKLIVEYWLNPWDSMSANGYTCLTSHDNISIAVTQEHGAEMVENKTSVYLSQWREVEEGVCLKKWWLVCHFEIQSENEGFYTCIVVWSFKTIKTHPMK